MKPEEENTAMHFDFDDIQSLLRFGNGKLTESCFLLLKISEVNAARLWISQANISTASTKQPLPENSLQLAFSVEGMQALELPSSVIEGFSDEFIEGMQGNESRSRRLGDIQLNDPQQWAWGGSSEVMPHMLLLMYSVQGGMVDFKQQLEDESFNSAFDIVGELPTDELGDKEPFGFVDGISQPRIDWGQQQTTDIHQRDHYSNWLALGEVILGYRNEYGLYTPRPLIDPVGDEMALGLPVAEDDPTMRDFGRNGCYLVIRQLQQDVNGFWQTMDQATNSDPYKTEDLAASMVGRQRDGTPLVTKSQRLIPGIPRQSVNNQFNFDLDADGIRCPVSSHIRRSNPRTGDYPADVSGFWSRMIRLLGFAHRRPDDDLIASSRFHRLLRRGRSYGPGLQPQDAIKKEALVAERGLEFICLVGNISRQFEFVQNAWIMSSNFGGLQNERDPLLGTREDLLNETKTDQFRCPKASGIANTSAGLPQFVTVRGGGYFFMPGIRAMRYLAKVTEQTEGDS